MLKVHHISSDRTFLNFSAHLFNTLQHWSFLNAPPGCDLAAISPFLIRRIIRKNQPITVIKHVCCGADTSQKPACVLEAHTVTIPSVASCISFSWTRGHLILCCHHAEAVSEHVCQRAPVCLSPASLRAFLLCFPSQELPGLHAHEVDSV